ncbi:hypothetical protein H5410_022227 [Solanum commersonii]|uniref:SWIM-type domain-containing protein n=1 Tax=Solanum commersonii TaxID=4109 RepID=A0A9J5ZE72_SOLCO|nr:hypothetical protein H5410_022227 [Solanum commersonii]
MGDRILVAVDCNGEWVESNNRYIWRWKSKELAATIAMIVHQDIAYDDFANKIITCCKLNYEPRGVLRIYMVERLVENHNLCDDQQVLNEECGRMNMNISNEEREGQHILSPEVRNRLPIIGEVADRQAATHLKRVGFHRWSRAFFSGNRYNIMTTNIVKSVNSMFLNEREYPITALFDAINRRFAEKFHERRMKFINAPTIFVPLIEKDIAKNINMGNKLLVHHTAKYKYIVTGQDEVATVDLLAKSCTCKVFDIDKVPCPHAMAARCQYGDDYGRRFMSTPLQT